jgi:hypothetical protein
MVARLRRESPASTPRGHSPEYDCLTSIRVECYAGYRATLRRVRTLTRYRFLG